MKASIASTMLLASVVFAAAPAQAQPEFVKDTVTKMIQKVGVRVTTGIREPLDGDVTKGASLVGIAVGFSPGQVSGWRFPTGFTTFTENLLAPSGEQFATFKSRAIVGGVGYGWIFGKLSTGAALQTGISFNQGRLDPNAAQAFDSASPVSVKVGRSLLLRPQLKAEYFITEKFTVRTTVEYMLMQPAITVTTSAGSIANRWNASSFHASFGIGFYPFRK